MLSVHYSSTGRYIDLVQDNAKLKSRVSYPAVSINPNGTYIDLSFEEFYYTVSQSANYFFYQLSTVNFSSGRNVGLLSYSDSNFLWNMLGLMATNVLPVLLSPRNSTEAIIHLINESGSRALVYQDRFSDLLIEIKKQIPELILIPKWIAKFPEYLSPLKYQYLIPLESKEKELDNISYILHSSGSTSFPKLAAQTNRVCHNSGYRFKLENTPLDRKELIFFPLFHASGILTTLIMCIYQMKSMIICPDLTPGCLFSPKMIIDAVKNLNPKLIMILPLMAIEIIEYCDKVDKNLGWNILRNLDI